MSPLPALERPEVVVPFPARAGRVAPDWQVLGRQDSAASAPELWLAAHLPGQAPGQDPEAVPEVLERLGHRAQRFTPRVSLAPPDGLLLEVQGSLHLFGGLAGLTGALADECHGLGLKPTLALAPVPLAALTAARAGQAAIVTSVAQLVGLLAPLPLMTLRWPQETLDRLASMGVRTIGQALRLPRAGLARRVGPEQLASLDRLVGREPDLRRRFEVRERFRRRRELLHELEHHERLLAQLMPLLEALGRFLEARQQGILELTCLLLHRQAPPTACMLRLAGPQADAQRLAELLGERLRTLTLPEPVRALELRSGALVPRPQAPSSLWQPGEHGGSAGSPGSPGTDLLERLRARLGPEAVYGLEVIPGHRPETAWAATDPCAEAKLSWGPKPTRRSAYGGRARPAGEQPPLTSGRRPVWLLRAPQRLLERAGQPWRQGPLRILSGPERIETGWWDGGEVRRDYYIACDRDGVRLWIFREHAAPRQPGASRPARVWYLHGVWG
jgi:protein ImuB